MSVNKHFRTAWIRLTYREAVRIFRDSLAGNEDADLAELARQSANAAFQQRAHLILAGQQEVTARRFMDTCRENFGVEIHRAAAERQSEPLIEMVN